MPVLTPTSPSRADHRFLRKLISSILGGKVEERASELQLISDIFRKAGGSWERIFKGSPSDIQLLKDVIKWAFKKKHLTKKQEVT